MSVQIEDPPKNVVPPAPEQQQGVGMAPANGAASPPSAPVFSSFKALEPKNPDNADQKDLVERYNAFLARGGRNDQLDVDALRDVLSAAKGGEPQISDADVLSNPERFYQLIYKEGKTPPPLAQQITTPSFWYNAPGEIAQGAWNVFKGLFVGGMQIAADQIQSINPFISQKDRDQAGGRVAMATAAGLKQNLWVLPQQLVNGTRDLLDSSDAQLSLNLVKEPAQREALERRQSETIRQRMIREQGFEQSVRNVQNDVAGALRMVGLSGQADKLLALNPQPTPDQQAFAQFVTDPVNLAAFGAGKAATVLKAGSRLQTLEAAVSALNRADSEVTRLGLQRQGLETALRSATDSNELTGLQKSLAELAPQERAATAARDSAAAQAAQSRAVTQSELDDLGKPGLARQVFGSVTGAMGRVAESVGKGIETFGELPVKLAERVMGSQVDEATKAVGAKVMGHFLNSAFYGMGGAAVGGPLGAMTANTLGPVIRHLGAEGLQAVGRDLTMAGKQFQLGRATLPFWKGIAENTTGLSSVVASFLDNPITYAIPDLAKGAATGGVLGGATGFVQSGGQAQPTLQGAGSGGLFGAAGGGLGQLGRFRNGGSLRAASIGDRSRFLKTLDPQSQRLFQSLVPDEQLALSVYALAHPDLRIQFFEDSKASNGSHLVSGQSGQVSINVAGDAPLSAILQHEIGHHVAAHGLGQTVADYMLGNPLSAERGMFTKLDDQGSPLLETLPDGSRRYLPDERFERYKADYNARLRRDNPQANPESDYGIAQELFAELHATHFGDPRAVQRLVRGTIPSGLVNPNALSNWFSRLGMGHDALTGNPLATDSSARVRGLTGIVSRYYKERAYRSRPLDEEGGLTRILPDEWHRNPQLVTRLLDGAGILKRDPLSGSVLKDPITGLPVIKSSREADADFARFTRKVLDLYRNNPRLEGEANSNFLKLVTDRSGRQVYRGQLVPEEVFDTLRAQNQFNPVQIANWQRVNGITRRNDGTVMLGVYNTAGRGGRYATLGVKERSLVPLYTEISPETGQVNFQMYDPEQMARNASKLLRRPQAQAVWGKNVALVMDDVKSYFDNLANGRPGETGLGLTKKGMINELFGVDAAANPYVGELTRRSPSVFKTLRLDRLNQIREIGGRQPVGAQTYEQVRSFMMPRKAAAEGVRAPEELRQNTPQRQTGL